MAIEWLALGYNIPINPSRNRVYVWRKLKEFGAEYFRSGVAVLPNTPENLKSFRELSKRILEMQGEATLVEMSFLDVEDEQEMVDRFRRQTQSDYQKLLEQAQRLLSERSLQQHSSSRQIPGRGESDTRLRQLLRQLDKVKTRDHFMSAFTEDLERGFTELLSTLRDTAGDFGKQLRKTLSDHRSGS